jgi:hypothetical protein
MVSPNHVHPQQYKIRNPRSLMGSDCMSQSGFLQSQTLPLTPGVIPHPSNRPRLSPGSPMSVAVKNRSTLAPSRAPWSQRLPDCLAGQGRVRVPRRGSLGAAG